MPSRASDILVETTAKAARMLLGKRIITAASPQEQASENFREGKMLVFIGGGRASGKTSMREMIIGSLEGMGFDKAHMAKLGSFIIEDILTLPKVQGMRELLNSFGEKAAATHEDDERSAGFVTRVGQRIIEDSIAQAISQNSPIIVDHHMDNGDFVAKVVEQAEEAGYETIMISPHISLETFFARAEARAQKTGRPTETEPALEKHRQFSMNLPAYIKMFDLSIVMNNDRDGEAPQPAIIASAKGVRILDEEVYNGIKAKIDINTGATSAREIFEAKGAGTEQPGARVFDNAFKAAMEQRDAEGRTRAGMKAESQKHLATILEAFEASVDSPKKG